MILLRMYLYFLLDNYLIYQCANGCSSYKFVLHFLKLNIKI